jgi:hypothetical protein
MYNTLQNELQQNISSYISKPNSFKDKETIIDEGVNCVFDKATSLQDLVCDCGNDFMSHEFWMEDETGGFVGKSSLGGFHGGVTEGVLDYLIKRIRDPEEDTRENTQYNEMIKKYITQSKENIVPVYEFINKYAPFVDRILSKIKDTENTGNVKFDQEVYRDIYDSAIHYLKSKRKIHVYLTILDFIRNLNNKKENKISLQKLLFPNEEIENIENEDKVISPDILTRLIKVFSHEGKFLKASYINFNQSLVNWFNNYKNKESEYNNGIEDNIKFKSFYNELIEKLNIEEDENVD